MKRAPVAAAVAVLAGILLWLTVVWVPAGNPLLAWSETGGELTAAAPGPAILPRWSHERLAAATVGTQLQLAVRSGERITVEIDWRPAPGSYKLAPADSPWEGLRRRVGRPVEEFLAALDFGCLMASAEVPGCPEDATRALAAEVAAVLRSDPETVSIRLTPDLDAVREYRLAAVARDLPAAGRKVLVLGLDGLDWDLVLPYIEAGVMPNLRRLMRIGTWGTMETIVPTLSPLIWTTMATGVTPDAHGILDFVEKDPSRGVMVPITGRGRRVPAVWNLASAFGRTVDTVGWWATWPAERIHGVQISDRLYYTLTQGLTKEVLREELPNVVFPPARAQEFSDLRDRAVRETDWRALRFFMDLPEARYDEAIAADRGMDDPIDGFRRLLAATRTYLGAGLQLATEQPDLLMVYLEGTDTIGHLLAPYMPPPTLDVAAADAALYAGAVPRYFQIVDRWLGRFIQQCPPSDYAIVLVSDHGFKWHSERPRGLSGTDGPTAALWHAQDAVFLVAGAGIEPLGRVETEASVYDLAPTVVSLLGLPPGTGWRGKPLPGVDAPALEPVDYLALVPPSSYLQNVEGVAPEDPEFVDMLRALGYLEEDGGGSSSQHESPTGNGKIGGRAAQPAAPPASETRAELNNLAILKIGEKKYDEAEEILRRAIAQSPDYPSPHYNLRRIYFETQRYDDADRELWRAVDKGLRDSERTVDRAAGDYEGLGMQARAGVLLTEALRRFPEHEPLWVHLMVAKIRLEDCAGARNLGDEAAVKFPASAPVHAFHGIAAACVGDIGVARSALERSLQLNPDQDTLRNTLAQLPGPSTPNP